MNRNVAYRFQLDWTENWSNYIIWLDPIWLQSNHPVQSPKTNANFFSLYRNYFLCLLRPTHHNDNPTWPCHHFSCNDSDWYWTWHCKQEWTELASQTPVSWHRLEKTKLLEIWHQHLIKVKYYCQNIWEKFSHMFTHPTILWNNFVFLFTWQ